jgi:hypothetical protein
MDLTLAHLIAASIHPYTSSLPQLLKLHALPVKLLVPVQGSGATTTRDDWRSKLADPAEHSATNPARLGEVGEGVAPGPLEVVPKYRDCTACTGTGEGGWGEEPNDGGKEPGWW